MAADLIIKLENIKKDYVSEDVKTCVLKGINLEIKRGDFIAIRGRSGSGKSTLMNLIGLLDVPTYGKYYLNGKDVSKKSENEKAFIRNKEIGFVFQQFNLLNRASALDNVILPALYAAVSPHDRRKKALDMLKKLGLEDDIKKRPSQLSGGQQQRVAIARALMNDPSIILADEPTGNLDTKSGEDVMAILKKLNSEGKTIILITHEKDIAAFAKKTMLLAEGLIETNHEK
ncbi:MAG: macrolide ABC transporter ATP-binding protein [Candidatus Levybacteria bacterium RBG_16_35_11]|nr:MAG: macrolide ABC transporter ATP-binding protein [Candidatus Levybacteria bacterium RBG_16_35_11]